MDEQSANLNGPFFLKWADDALISAASFLKSGLSIAFHSPIRIEGYQGKAL